MVDQIALSQELPVSLAGVSAEKPLIDRVVNNFDAGGRDANSFSTSLLVKLETAKIRAAPFSARWVR